LTDALGYPIDFHITGGEVHDVTQADHLLLHQTADYVIADKGYDDQTLIDRLSKRGIESVIPPRKNRLHLRPYDRFLYKERNLIERCFNKLKQARRIATRYEKTLTNYKAFLYLASIMIWLR